MKRLCCFLCLLLCVCLCLPASLISAFALVEVDSNNVYLAWWYDDPQDYVSFTNQVTSTTSLPSIVIQVDIVLSQVVEAKETFDFEFAFNASNYGAINVVKCQPLNSSSVAIDNITTTVVDNKISLYDLNYKQDVHQMRLQFQIQQPTWRVKNLVEEISLNIAGKSYKAEKGMTWGDWVVSDYDSLGLYEENGYIFGANVQLMYQNIPVRSTDTVFANGIYTLYTYQTSPLKIFKLNGIGYIYVDGMTWKEYCNSSYNEIGFYLDKYTNYVYAPDGEIIKEYKYVALAGKEIWIFVGQDNPIEDFNYCTDSYIESISTFSLVQYEFDFEVTSANVEIVDEKGLLNGIIGWLQNVWTSIKELPGQIANLVGQKLMELGSWLIDQIKGLFIPSEESIIELKTKFEELLRDRFGAVYDSADIIDDFASSFAYSDTDTSVTFPQVTVNLAGTNFTFGGWEVDVIPDRFEGIVDFLKLLVSMVATVLFVNALRKRLEDILE